MKLLKFYNIKDKFFNIVINNVINNRMFNEKFNKILKRRNFQ